MPPLEALQAEDATATQPAPTGAAGLAVGAQPATMHLAAMQGAISGAGITAGTMDAQPMMVDFSGALQMGATVMLPNGIEVPAVSAVALEAQQARIAAAQHAHAQMAAAHQQAQMHAMHASSPAFHTPIVAGAPYKLTSAMLEAGGSALAAAARLREAAKALPPADPPNPNAAYRPPHLRRAANAQAATADVDGNAQTDGVGGLEEGEIPDAAAGGVTSTTSESDAPSAHRSIAVSESPPDSGHAPTQRAALQADAANDCPARAGMATASASFYREALS